MTDVQLDLVSNERALAQHAEAIRVLGKRAVRDIIEIGRRLTDAKELAGHGGWLPWLDREFGWKEQSARNFMQVYALSLKSPRLGDFNITFEGLYLLASPSAAEAREAIIKRTKDGERLTLAEVRRMTAEAKQAQAEENAERRAADLAKAEERLEKLRASFAEREKKIRKEQARAKRA